MTRVKRGKTHTKRRRNILKKVKGYGSGRKNLLKRAKQAAVKAGQHAFRDRRKKKREMRGLWNARLSAALKELGWSYSKFIHALKSANSGLDRKVLSQLAAREPEAFRKLVEILKK